MNRLLMFWNLQKAAVKTFARFFQMKYQWFWNQQEAAVNPLLMFWNLQKAAVKTFARFAMEISMAFESSIDVFESPEGCCEDICTFCLGNINGFGISRRLL